MFPEDQQIELEYWAVTGEFSNTELSQMKVILFCIFCLFHFARKKYQYYDKTEIKKKKVMFHVIHRFRTTNCSVFHLALELCTQARRGQYTSATGQRS